MTGDALSEMQPLLTDLWQCQLVDSPEVLSPFLRQPELRQMLAHWQTMLRDRAGQLPSRADFAPEDLRYSLGHVVMFDVVPQQDAAPRFRYRLYGSHFTFARDFDLTGRFIEEHPNPHFAGLAARQMAQVTATRLPALGIGRIRQPDNLTYSIEALSLPLADDGCHPDVILVGQYDHHVAEAALPLQLNIAEPALLRPWIKAEPLGALYDLWHGIAQQRKPRREDFPPERLHPWLGRVLLVERVGMAGSATPPSLRYRLIGSYLAADRGFDLTGKSLDEHPDPDFGKLMHRLGLEALRLGRPAWYRGDGYTPSGYSLRIEGIALPITSRGEDYDMLLVCQVPVEGT